MVWTELWSIRSEERLRFSPGTVLEAENKGVGLMATFFDAVEKAGIDIAYQAKVTAFLQDRSGRVTGVRVQSREAPRRPMQQWWW